MTAYNLCRVSLQFFLFKTLFGGTNTLRVTFETSVETQVGLHTKCPLLTSVFSNGWDVSNFTKILSAALGLLHADGQADMTKPTGALLQLLAVKS
jgi:hypothetical protein